MKCCLCMVVLLFCCSLPCCNVYADSSQETIVTLWPLVDYRHDPQSQYTRWGFLGPFIHWSRSPEESRAAFRPLFYSHHTVADERTESEILYPIYTHRSTTDDGRVNLLNLFQDQRNADEGSEWTLFPFLYYSRDAYGEADFAIFPLGGTIHRRFGKDRIQFTLFPLYSETQTEDIRVQNVLWPFLATIDGPDTSGFKIWPLYGQSERPGVFRKRYWLWPFFYSYQEGLDTESPRYRTGFFPLYLQERTPTLEKDYVLWPFFGRIDDRDRQRVDTWYPWPLVGTSEGEGVSSQRYLPLYADVNEPNYRKRWWLWPLFQRVEKTGMRYRARDRLLFFLYSDLQQGPSAEEIQKRRIALWPLFTWERVNGRERFFCLSLLEPFFPENASIDRSWGPLWRLYQSQVEPDGTQIRSFLWNLYWEVSRGEDTAYELFPLLQVKKQMHTRTKEFKVLKGLLGYKRQGDERYLYFLFLPIPLNQSDSSEADAS